MSIYIAPNHVAYAAISVSLPNFLNGSNVTLLTPKEVGEGLELLSALASDLSMSRCDLKEARVRNVDFATNLQVDPMRIRETIDLISHMSISRFRRSRYSDTSAYYQWNVRGEYSRFRTIAVYSKEHERNNRGKSPAEAASAAGIIRLEARFRKTDVVKRLATSMGLLHPTVSGLINQTIAKKILDPLTKQMNRCLSQQAEGDPLAVLKDIYGYRRADALISHLIHMQVYGDGYYKIQELGRGKNSYFALQRDCRNAGIESLEAVLHFPQGGGIVC